MQQKIRTKFKELFNTEGSLYTSPGRINLIGEHTDYNGGFVFPGAVDKGMIAEIKPNGTGKVRAFSIDLNDYAEFRLEPRRTLLPQAGQDISLAYAGRLLNEVAISKVSIPYSLETYLWALECLLPPHWKVLMLSH